MGERRTLATRRCGDAAGCDRNWGNRAANGCVWFCHDGERHGLELEDVARGESVVWEVLGMEEERRGDEAMTGMEYEEVRASE